MPITETQFRASILPFTLSQEGGYSVDRNDPGNWTGGRVGSGTLAGTKFGIAAASHPGLDIRALTIEEACSIYWRDYAVAPGFTLLPLPLALVAFDSGVNCGTGRAKAWLPAAQKAGDVVAQVEAFSARSLAYHQSLPTWPRYGRAWGGRISRCRTAALALEAQPPKPPAGSGVIAVQAPSGVAAAPKPAHQIPAGVLSRLRAAWSALTQAA